MSLAFRLPSIIVVFYRLPGGNLHPKTKKSPFPGWERGWNEDLGFGPLLIFPMRAGIGTGPNFHLFNVGPVVVASKGQIPQPLSMRLRVT